jgi:hypothetical protein
MPEIAPQGLSAQQRDRSVPATTATMGNGAGRNNARTRAYRAPGMRRVRLLVWKLYYQTPLKIKIAEWVERGAARHCKMSWEEYCRLKAAHPDLWQRWAEKRKRAVAVGHFPPQPWQLRKHRMLQAPMKAKIRKPRHRFYEWAGKKLVRQRGYKYPGLRKRVVDRLFLRLIGL